MTSGLYRTDTSSFRWSDVGRPRTDRRGTMALNCFGVSGCASRSPLAAAVMARSSAAGGRAIRGFLRVFDIVLHLAPVGAAQADDPPRVATIDEGHVVQRLSLRRKRNHPGFVVVTPFINRVLPVSLRNYLGAADYGAVVRAASESR